MPLDLISLFPELQAQQQKIKRQQQLAMALQQQLQQSSPNEVVSGIVVKKSPLEGLAKMGQAYFAKQNMDDLDKKDAAIGTQAQQMAFGSSFKPQDLANGLSNSPTALPATPAQSLEPGAAPMQQPAQDNGNFTSLEDKNGLPHGLLQAVMKQESGGNPNAVSSAGAQGAFQFMPDTAKQYGIDPMNPQQSAQGAASYLGDLNKKYGGDLAKALAAYNWGPGNVDKKGLENAPSETQNYVTKVGGQFANLQPNQGQQQGPPQNPLAAGLQNNANQSNPSMPNNGSQVNGQTANNGQPQPGTQSQDNGIMGNLFAKRGISPQEGMVRLMMGDESVLKTPTAADRYKVVGGNLVDLISPDGPKIVSSTQGTNNLQARMNEAATAGITGDDFLKTLSPGDAAVVKMVAEGDEKSSTVLSRLKADEKLAILSAVHQYNPTYNARQFGNTTQFETGKLGNTIRSLNVAGSHLQTLDGLSDALNNGNTQLFNRVANEFSKQTGSPAVTNFDSAKEIVGDEVAKAVVGATGALGDREAIKENIKSASSPQQLKGVIRTYINLINGQKSGLQQQYEQSTGKKDFNRLLEGPTASPASPTPSPNKIIKWNDLK